MIATVKKKILNMAPQLPNSLNARLLEINRDPVRVYGRAYGRYRDMLRQNQLRYDPIPKLLNAVQEAIRQVPFYNRLYSDAVPGNLEEFEEYIGFIDKEVILDDYESFKAKHIDLSGYDIGTTGGTSGKPLQLIAPKDRYVVEMATMHALWGRAGYQFDVRAVIRNHRLADDQQFSINPVTREVIFDGFRLNPDYFAVIYHTIKRFNIHFVHCYPSAANEFALFLKQNRLDTSFIHGFLSGSENIFEYQRDLIQNQLGIRFYNWYGHSEKLVLAGYCEATDYYHVEPTYGYFELIDEYGRPIREPGKTGEITGTSFHNPGMPFVRYKTGDFAEYVGDFCPACGRHVPIIRNIRGRWSGDRIYNADGSFVTTTALNLHNNLYQVINGMQYVQERKGDLTVLIIKSADYTLQHEADLYRHFHQKLHPDSIIKIEYVNSLLRRPNGKFVHIISRVNE